MADVTKIDIDGVQWNIKDQNARDLISALESRLNGYKSIRHDIETNPPQETNNIWSYLMNQILNTDWSFITDGVYAYGKFTIFTVGWGNYKAIKFPDGTIILSGILEYGLEPHTFGANYYPPSNAWRFNIDGEGLSYLQNNILITHKMSRENNGFTIPTEITVRNVEETTIGNLYNALDACDLLNRPSSGIIVWDLTHTHNGVDLPKIKRGFPQIASADEFDLSGRVYLQNVRIGKVDEPTAMWWCTWNDGNIYEAGNMYGEDFKGIVKTVTMVFAV